MGYKKKRKKKIEREVTESKDKITLCWKSQTHPAERGNFFLFNNRLPPDCCNRRNITKAFKKELEKRLWCQPWDLCSIFICFLFTPFCACFCQSEQRETPRAQLPRRARTHLQMSTAGLLSPEPSTDLIRTDSCRLLPLSESRGEEHSGLEEAMVKKLECEKRSLINTLDPPHSESSSGSEPTPDSSFPFTLKIVRTVWLLKIKVKKQANKKKAILCFLRWHKQLYECLVESCFVLFSTCPVVMDLFPPIAPVLLVCSAWRHCCMVTMAMAVIYNNMKKRKWNMTTLWMQGLTFFTLTAINPDCSFWKKSDCSLC